MSVPSSRFNFQGAVSPGGDWPPIVGVPLEEPTAGGSSSSGSVPTGALLMWGAASAPTGWLMCDGTAVSRTKYSKLFSLYGTTFGVGDGSTTFNLPDFRQRFPIGKAAAGTGSTLGGTGGTIDHTHDNHTTQVVSTGAGQSPLSGPTTHSAVNPPFLSVNFIIKT